MKKFTVEFYSSEGFLLGESVREFNDFSEAESKLKKLMEKDGFSIISKDKLENVKKDIIFSKHIAKISITEQA